MNATWHLRHPMPTRPSLDQRVRWHLAHAKACGCREIPGTVVAEIGRRETPARAQPRRRQPAR